MKKRVTILTGAGFTFSNEFGGPSTLLLTNKLRTLKIPGHSIDGKTPGEYFYRKLCHHYTRRTKNDCDLSIVNFETIVHLLEELFSHLTSYNKPDIKHKTSDILKNIAKSKGVKPSFLVLKDTISKDLRALVTPENKLLNQIIRTIYSYFIDSIVEELIIFNNSDQNQGMRQFEAEFLQRYLPSSNFTRRFYTLNYDTWLNKYLGFYDGFDKTGKFESEKVMGEFDLDCHYNLHGSILWENDLSANRIKKLTKPVEYLKFRRSSDYSLNREPLIATPIITGYHKLERMKFTPYLQFYYSLQNDILNSDLLLLVGYSFSDTHINNIISLFKGKCITVSYIEQWVKAENEEKNVTPSGTPINYDNVGFDLNNSDVDSIIQSITPFDGGFEPKEIEIQSGWIKSRNGNTRFWWKGIGAEFYQNWPQIIA